MTPLCREDTSQGSLGARRASALGQGPVGPYRVTQGAS